MQESQERNFTEKEFVSNNKKKVINVLYLITFIISITFIDYYLLPNTKTEDNLVSYTINRAKKSRHGSEKEIVSYNYYTKKGNSFSTKNYLLEEDNIEIEYTLLLKTVTKVKSKDTDYTKYLVNGLNPNGIELYCCFIILLSIAISLKILLSKNAVSENTFYNIICFNGFMLFVTFYMMYLF